MQSLHILLPNELKSESAHTFYINIYAKTDNKEREIPPDKYNSQHLKRYVML
jgi:hypothetical protein